MAEQMKKDVGRRTRLRVCGMFGSAFALLLWSTPAYPQQHSENRSSSRTTGGAPDANAGSDTSSTLDLRIQHAIETSNRDRVTSGYYAHSRDYRLIYQGITLYDVDWATRSFKGHVTTTLVALRTSLGTVRFDAGARLQITRVVDDAGRTLAFAHAGDTLVVTLSRPVPYRDTLRLTIDYQGKEDKGLHFVDSTGPQQPRQFWSASGQPTWVPTCMFQDNKITWDLTMIVPRALRVISNGRLVRDGPAHDAPRGEHAVHWHMERPASTYLLAFVVSPVVTVRDRWRNVPLEYNVYPADSALARRAFSMTAKAMEAYSRLTGVPYPWSRYAQTEVANAPWAGMETVTATTVMDELPRTGWAPSERPFFVYQVVPHELAHQWFGDYVTHDDRSGIWLGEGFAHFMTGQFWHAEFGDVGRDEFFLEQYQRWMQSDAGAHVAVAGPSVKLVYSKGSLVLEMLRKYLGDTLFWASIHEFLTRFAYGNATVDDWRRAIFDVTGENLDWFFDEWIYGAGYPEFTVAAAYDSSARRLVLTVEQTQRPHRDRDVQGNDTAYYDTPAVFQMPVTIRAGEAGQDVVHHTWLRARRQTITIDGVMHPPKFVAFDDENAIAKTLHFDMPTEWLAALLARDTNAWNDWWTIQQLQGRRAEPAAVAALRAAAHSRYPFVRAQASQALAQGQ